MGYDNNSKKANAASMISNPEDAMMLRDLVDSTHYMVRVLDADKNIVYMNKKMRDEFSELDRKVCSELFRCNNDCMVRKSWDTGKSEEKVFCYGDRSYKVVSSPLTNSLGKRFSIEIFHDITEQKSIEQELIDRYKTLTADLNIAKNIQKRILPKDGIYWNAIKLSSLYLPSKALAGDIYDIIRINKDSYLMYIADVSGHGVHASLITMFVKEVVRGNLMAAAYGLDFMLNELMESYVELNLDPEIYFSLLLCKYNRSKKELKIANAGHNCYPLIIRRNGDVEEIKAIGLPISMLGNVATYTEVKTHLNRGDRLVLYTDGITEEFNEEEQKAFGAEGVRNILKSNAGLDGKSLAIKIVDSASDYSTVRLAKDDRAIMIADIL